MPDVVTAWNDVLLEVYRDVGGAPGPLARGGAMVHGAIHDAVTSVVPAYEPYLVRVPTSPSASVEAAVAYAAHDALAAAFPSSTVDLAAELGKALALLPPGTTSTQVAAGRAVGEATAAAMVAARQDDGAEVNLPYVAAARPGQWQPTGSGGAASPNWPSVRPFCMISGRQFRPPRPGGYASITELLRSPEYAAQLNEVQTLGSSTSSSRTADQTEIATFWANDLDGTYKPPGHLFAITQVVSAQRGLDVLDNARLFALVALAMADAAVVAWDAKYATDLDLWRPESAVRLADDPVLGDGNPSTTGDPAWVPLSFDPVKAVHFSPPFPAYVSGHATFGAAHSAVMRGFFGTDNVTFTAPTEDPNLPAGTTRTFSSFSEAARENARSRVYLGVHFQWDGDHGNLSGDALGQHVVATRLRPLPLS